MRILLTFILLFSVTSCGGDSLTDFSLFGGDDAKQPLKEVKDKTPSAQKLYDEAKHFLNVRRYSKAIEKFKEIERVYPFDKLANTAQVMTAYSEYKDNEYDDAIAVIDKFIRLSPGSSDTEYMYYIKALSYYDRIADVKRDQKVTKLALKSLKELITRYPDSKYSRDAKLKIDLVNDHLAGKEMEIGRYYLKDNKFVAAINRFEHVVDKYQNTSHIEEALYRLTEANLSIGLNNEATHNAAVLGHNYPDSKWYKYAYQLLEGKKSGAESSWLSFIGIDTTEKTNTKKELPKSNIADNWFDKFIDIF